MSFYDKVREFLREYFLNTSWACNSCGVEIFSDGYFCDECEKALPYNEGRICDHCGRKILTESGYCNTCKGRLVALDKGRSAFVYDKKIKTLIQKAKYFNSPYIMELFAHYLYPVYVKNFFNADLICYIPMTKKALENRGYNQSEILARSLSKKIGVPVTDCLEKTKETTRQAKLKKKDRLTNLKDAFRVKDKKAVKGKTILIVDDVTTTGATAENIAEKLKSAGAVEVFLLTVASVPSKDGY